jgi:endonuclease/exonuclease/phosphatase family metal-dependent hydrolase
MALVRRIAELATGVLAVGAVAGGVAVAPAAAEPVEIRVLSYNTHGLAAWIAGDDPETRFPRIGALAGGYDVALLQEDFAHHERLRGSVVHPVIARGNESRFSGSWPCPFCRGSGLTLLARWEGALVSLANVAYETCSGWLDRANDCFATKGFQHARLRLPGGALLDFVNTHLDAGRAAEDREARRAQISRLRDHLAREAAGRALVLAGDLNLDAAVPEDAALRDALVADLGLVDSGARPAAGTDWERVDYIYVRSGEELRVEVLAAGEDRAFRHEAEPLSDHPALFARLRVVDARRRGTGAPTGSSRSRRPRG